MAKPKTIYKLFALQGALMDVNLSKADVSVLAILIEYQNGLYGYAWPSVETIGKVAGLSRRGVQNSLRRLEACRYIETQRGGGRRFSNRYIVAIKDDGHSPLAPRIRDAATETANQRAQFNDADDQIETAKSRTERAQICTERAKQRAPEPYLPEPTDINPSTNVASLGSDADSASKNLGMRGNVGAQLAIIERNLKEGKALFGIQGTRQELYEVIEDDWLDDNVRGWAARLCEDLAELEGYEDEGERRWCEA